MGTRLPRTDRSLTVACQEPDIGHWQKALARHLWFLRRAGIASAQIEGEIARSLGRFRRIRSLPVSAANERMLARVLTHWQHESVYLDDKGQPRALRFGGRAPTFRSLVRAAVPGADASTALAALKRHRLVSHGASGVIRQRTVGIVRGGVQRGPLLMAALGSLDALTDTCYSQLCARRPLGSSSRLPRTAYTEQLDRHDLRAYEEFLTESAHVFLAMHESWLKRHEVNSGDPRRKHIGRVGVGVFAIRGR